jgi:hypothetical protein
MSTVMQFFFSTQPLQLIGTVVNVTILAIGMGAVLELLRASWRLRNDHLALLRFKKEAHNSGHPDTESLGRTLPEQHLLSRRLEIVRSLRAAGADIEPAALSALAVNELDGGVRWTRWANSTVVLFGLGGTLMGLSQAVIKAQPMLGDLVSGPAAVQAVMDTFSGLGTAFSTTLMGILWAVLLSVSLTSFRRSQGRYLHLLEEVSLVLVYPYFRTSPATAMVEAAQKLTTLEARLGQALTELVSQVRTQGLALTKTVEDSVSDLVDHARGSGDALRRSVEESMGQVVRETHERGLALTSTVDRSFTALTDDLRSGTIDLVSKLEETQRAMQALLGEPGADSRTLAQNLSALQAGVDAMRQAADGMLRMAPAVEEVLARQFDRQTRDLHETMHAYTGRLGAAVERQDDLVETGLARLEQGIGGFGDVLLEQLREHDREILNEVRDRTTQVGESLTGLNLLVTESFTRLEQGLTRFGEGLAEQVREHEKGLLEDIGAQVGTLQSVLGEQLAGIGKLESTVRQLSVRLLSETLPRIGEPHGGHGILCPPELTDGMEVLAQRLETLGGQIDRLQRTLQLLEALPGHRNLTEEASSQQPQPASQVGPGAAGYTPPSAGATEPVAPVSSKESDARREAPALRPPGAPPILRPPAKEPGFFARLFGKK